MSTSQQTTNNGSASNANNTTTNNNNRFKFPPNAPHGAVLQKLNELGVPLNRCKKIFFIGNSGVGKSFIASIVTEVELKHSESPIGVTTECERVLCINSDGSADIVYNIPGLYEGDSRRVEENKLILEMSIREFPNMPASMIDVFSVANAGRIEAGDLQCFEGITEFAGLQKPELQPCVSAIVNNYKPKKNAEENISQKALYEQLIRSYTGFENLRVSFVEWENRDIDDSNEDEKRKFNEKRQRNTVSAAMAFADARNNAIPLCNIPDDATIKTSSIAEMTKERQKMKAKMEAVKEDFKKQAEADTAERQRLRDSIDRMQKDNEQLQRILQQKQDSSNNNAGMWGSIANAAGQMWGAYWQHKTATHKPNTADQQEQQKKQSPSEQSTAASSS